MRDGTLLFVTAAVGLTLPALATAHWKRTGSEELPKFVRNFLPSADDLRRFGYFVFVGAPTPRILSTPYTLVTHMLHHADLAHWATNVAAISTTACSLDLGFWRSTILFVGGGISGALALFAEWAWLRDGSGRFNAAPLMDATKTMMSSASASISSAAQNLVSFSNESSVNGLPFGRQPSQASSWTTFFPNPKNDSHHIPFSNLFSKTHALCGASAGIFALAGAECYLAAASLYRIFGLKSIRRSNQKDTTNERHYHDDYSDNNRRRFFQNRQRRTAELAAISASRIATIAFQFIALFESSPISSPQTSVGYSAHIGGFMFGFVAMSVMDWW